MTIASPPTNTIVITVKALTEQGQLSSGYRLDDEPRGEPIDPSSCSEPSGSGSSPGTYACGASMFQADACWRHESGDLACLDLPWDRSLFRMPIDGDLPTTEVSEHVEPLGLQLEDGSRYRHRNGPGSGTPPEGFNDIYNSVEGPCSDDPDVTTAVMVNGDAPAVNVTSGAWSVLVGQMATGSADPTALPSPKTQSVVRAWFIALG